MRNDAKVCETGANRARNRREFVRICRETSANLVRIRVASLSHVEVLAASDHHKSGRWRTCAWMVLEAGWAHRASDFFFLLTVYGDLFFFAH
mgnify:CR=1 FL=1